MPRCHLSDAVQEVRVVQATLVHEDLAGAARIEAHPHSRDAAQSFSAAAPGPLLTCELFGLNQDRTSALWHPSAHRRGQRRQRFSLDASGSLAYNDLFGARPGGDGGGVVDEVVANHLSCSNLRFDRERGVRNTASFSRMEYLRQCLAEKVIDRRNVLLNGMSQG